MEKLKWIFCTVLIIVFGLSLTCSFFEIEPELLNSKIKIERENQNHTIKNHIRFYTKVNENAFYLSEYERWVVCCMIAGEAAGETYEGQWAVAQCIYQACVNDNILPSEVKIEYQYDGWNESLEFDNPELWNQFQEITKRVFSFGDKVVNDEIIWFYAPFWMRSGVSEWHESQRFIIQIGGHKFFGEW